MKRVRFGFLPEPTVLEWSAGRVEPLPEYENIVHEIQGHPRVYGDWCYPPLSPVNRNGGEGKEPPSMPAVVFALPATHQLVLGDAAWSDENANFFIALFGMLKGLRLQREEWQHFYKAPVKPGTLCDFVAHDREIAQALEAATQFWTAYPDADVRSLAFGALHWHLFAQLYEHEFERFNAQYMAMDACWKLAQKSVARCPQGKFLHAERPGKLCELLGIPAPNWAIIPKGEKSCPLSERRNALIHEAMYGGHPVGFAYPEEHKGMALELTGFVARVLLRLFGIKNEYTRSPCTTRQTIGFSFG